MKNKIEHLFINNKILVKIREGMYGITQSGQLAYIVIIKYLQLHGYTHEGFTIRFFKHATRDTLFISVVYYFGVKYTAKIDALHLIDTLKKKYVGITNYWSGRVFLGIHLDWEYIKRNVTMSMPNYVNKSLSIFQH